MERDFRRTKWDGELVGREHGDQRRHVSGSTLRSQSRRLSSTYGQSDSTPAAHLMSSVCVERSRKSRSDLQKCFHHLIFLKKLRTYCEASFLNVGIVFFVFVGSGDALVGLQNINVYFRVHVIRNVYYCVIIYNWMKPKSSFIVPKVKSFSFMLKEKHLRANRNSSFSFLLHCTLKLMPTMSIWTYV